MTPRAAETGIEACMSRMRTSDPEAKTDSDSEMSGIPVMIGIAMIVIEGIATNHFGPFITRSIFQLYQ